MTDVTGTTPPPADAIETALDATWKAPTDAAARDALRRLWHQAVAAERQRIRDVLAHPDSEWRFTGPALEYFADLLDGDTP